MTFKNENEAHNQLWAKAKKLSFSTGKNRQACYEFLLGDKEDPTVAFIENNPPGQKFNFTDSGYREAEALLMREAEKIMLTQDLPENQAMIVAMDMFPDEAELYTTGGSIPCE